MATTGVVRSRADNQHVQIAPDPASSRASEAGISKRTQRKLDAVAQRRPDLLKEVQAGRKSAHRAAIEAGIVKEPTALEKIMKLLPALTPEERHKLKEMLISL